MILESIHLNNIRSYVEEEIKFPQGSTLLAGDIGTGKSTILLAIEFALFGTAKGQLQGESLLRKGANEGSVLLTFTLGNDRITLKTTHKKKNDGINQGAGYVILNNSKKEGTAVELKAQILNILGYPKEMLTKKNDLYRYTVYTPQEEMKHILYDSPDERQDTLRRIFGIDKYKNIRENAAVFLRALKEKQKELDIRLEGLQGDKELKEKLDSDCLRIRQELKENEKLQQKTEEELREIRGQLRETEKKSKRLGESKRELAMQEQSLQEKLEQITKNKEEITDAEAKIRELETKQSAIIIEPIQKEEAAIERDVAKLQKEVEFLKHHKTKTEERIKNLEQEEERLKREIQQKNEQTLSLLDKRAIMLAIEQEIKNNIDLKKQAEEIGNTLQETIVELSNFRMEEEQIRVRIEEIQSLDKCPKCKQNIMHEHKHKLTEDENSRMKEIAEKISKLKNTKKEKQEMMDRLNKTMEFVKEKEKEKIQLQSEIKRQEEILEEIVRLRTQLATTAGEKARTKETQLVSTEEKERQLLSFNDELKKAQRQKMLQKEKQYLSELIKEKQKNKNKLEEYSNEIKKQVGAINMKKKELFEIIESLKESEQKHEELRTKEEETKEKEKQFESAKASMAKELHMLEDQLNKIHAEIINKEKHQKEKARMQKIQNWLENSFVPLSGQIEKHVMIHIHNEFDNSFRQWFSTLIDDENLSIRLDDEFTPIIIQNSYETEIDNLSGGEKTSAALAYRLALNKVINHAIETIKTKDLIILDEPTDGFSMEQLDNVRKVLDELNLKQVIIVSHENKVESFVDNIIRIEKDNHVSRVVNAGSV
jgi:exonuclease SbcC